MRRSWRGYGDDGGAARRSERCGSAVANEVIPSCFRSSLSGDVLSLGCFNGDAVDGGVTLVVVAIELV